MAAIASLALATSACGSNSADAEKGYTFTFASSGPPSQGISKQMQWFMDEVEDRTDGRIKWKTHWAGALLPSTELLSGVVDGRADASFFASPYDPARFPLFHLGYVPTEGINAIGSALAWRELSENNELMQEEFTKAGVVPLIFAGVSDAATIAGSKKLETLDDLDGLKVRFAGPITEAISKTTGAEPLTINAEDLYSGMETGVINAIGGYAIDSLVGSGLQEVAPIMHTLATGYYASSISLIFNKQKWDDLPEDLKSIIAEVQDDYYKMLPEQLTTEEAKACDALIKADGGLVKFPADDSEAQSWLDEIGTSLVDTWVKSAVAGKHSEDEARAFGDEFVETAQKLSEGSDYVPGADACIAKSNL